MTCLYPFFFTFCVLSWLVLTRKLIQVTHEWSLLLTNPIWVLLSALIILQLIYSVWLHIQASKTEAKWRKNYGLGRLRRDCLTPLLTWDQKLFAVFDGQHITPTVVLKYQAEYYQTSRKLEEENWETILSQQEPFALELWKIQLSDSDLATLRNCGLLRSFAAHCCEMTENGFRILLETRQLESLSLRGVRIENQELTDDHVRRLQSLNLLRSLELGNSQQVTDQGIASLANLPQLELLSLVDISLNGEGFAPLTHLKNIALDWCSSHTDSLLERLVELRQLEGVYVGCSARFGDSGLAALARLPQLQKLVIYIGLANITDQGLASLQNSVSLRTLILWSCPKVTDKGVAFLANLENMESLELGSEKLTNAAMKSLKKMRGLKKLKLGSCKKINEEGLAELAEMKQIWEWQPPYQLQLHKRLLAIPTMNRLESFMLSGNDITDESMSALNEMVHLKKLVLSCCDKITDQELAVLALMPELEMLDLYKDSCLTDRGMSYIALLRKLQLLDLSGCNSLTDTGIILLSGLNHMRHLGLGQTQITGKGLAALASFARLKTLKLDWCDHLDDSGLASLPLFPKLEVLSLNRCEKLTGQCLSRLIVYPSLKELSLAKNSWLTDDDLEPLVNFPRLEILNLALCDGITDRALDRLKRCKHLKNLTVENCPRITRKKVDQFEKERPECRILFRTSTFGW